MNKFYGYEKEIKENKILSVQINLLNQCPSKCKSCRKYTWPHHKLSVKDVLNVLKYLKDQGCTSVFFSGGEPLVYQNFSDVIDYCVSIDLPYSLITTLICKNEELLEKVARTAYRIHVSLDAVDSELYKEIRGIDGFNLVSKNVDFINSIRDEDKIPIRFSSTIGVFNYSQVVNIYNFAKDKKCKVNFYYIQLWDGLKMNDSMESEFHSQLSHIINDETKNNKIISNAKSFFEKVNTETQVDRCYIPRISAIINCDGNIYPCCGLFIEFRDNYYDCVEQSYGNIINKTNDELKLEFAKRLKQYPLKCKECDDCIKINMRYNDANKNIEEIINFEKQPLFI